MTARARSHVGATLAYAAVSAAVLIAPAAALYVDARSSQLPVSYGADLLIGSSLVGAVEAAIAWRRVRSFGGRALNVWLASVNALAVLTLVSTGLIAAVLFGFADLHANLATDGWPVVALWVGLQCVGVVLSEYVAAIVGSWLADHTDGRVVLCD